MPRGVCKLCLFEKELQRSHLMPRAFYKILLEHGEDPIVMTPALVTHTSRQVCDYVLCKGCEDRFNKNGEAYLGTLVSRRDSFPFLDKLKLALAHREEKAHIEFSGLQVGIDTDKLAYFALSVLWRSGAHKWATLGQQTTSVDLGSYADVLRRFLLGETGFPADVGVIVTVCIDKGSQGFIFMPGQVREAKPDIQYTLAVLGIELRIIVGIPASRLEAVCCYHSANKVLFARNCHKEAQQGFNYLHKAAKISQRVRQKP
jgi:hypothetical protein